MIVDTFDVREVRAGTVARVRKRFGVTGDGNDAAYPLVVVAGATDGPVVTLIGGIHGDEYEGPAALWRLIRGLDAARIRGRVVTVPVAHTAAFAAGTRASPVDGVNLARCFPGDPDGTLTQRLAHDLFETVARPADALVDLHSGGVRYAFLPVAGFYGATDEVTPRAAAESFRLACGMGLDLVWRLPARAGVLSFEAARIGIAVTGCEAGGRGGCLETDVALYLRGIMRVLAQRGVLEPGEAEVAQSASACVLEGDFALAPAAGFLSPLVPLGTRVAKGEPLARIDSCDGATLTTLHAAADGIVMAERHLRAIQLGEWATCALPEVPL